MTEARGEIIAIIITLIPYALRTILDIIALGITQFILVGFTDTSR
nr:MAG TPA: hypothetical protein [Caudoviricetes sp.]